MLQTKQAVQSGRDIGLDVTRIAAFLSVVCVHFFLNTDFYSVPIVGIPLALLTVLRTFFMVCVPLFLLLTGYLMSGKHIAPDRPGLRGYYGKLAGILAEYALATCLIWLFCKVCLQQETSLRALVISVLGFDYYGWYVEMYIGLNMLVPFLNLIWRGIAKREGHRALVLILLLLTAAPSVFNIYDFTTPGALLSPWLSQSYTLILPDWWVNFYPITYYFIGAYLREYIDCKRLHTGKLALALAVCVLCFGLYNYWRSYSLSFIWGDWCDWGGFQQVIDSVLAFLLLNSISYRRVPQRLARWIGSLAGLTFGAYLLSWIPDHFSYPLTSMSAAALLPDAPLLVGFTVVSAMLLSAGMAVLKKALARACGRLKRAASRDSKESF